MGLDIFVAYWGDVALFKKTVRSVLAQQDDDWLLTVVDDAYPNPEAGQWLHGLNHPRVRYVRNEHNLGVVRNYRKLMSMGTQEHCVFLGCDDVLLPNYTQTVLSMFAQYPYASILQPGVKIIDENDADTMTLPDWVKKRIVMPVATQATVLQGESLAVSLLHGDWLYWPSVAFRTEALRQFEFDDSLKITHDLDLILDMVFQGHRMIVAPDVCFAYRRHSSSISAATLMDGRRFKEEKRCFAMAESQARSHAWPRAAWAARLHITSRLNACYMLLESLLMRKFSHMPVLARHLLG